MTFRKVVLIVDDEMEIRALLEAMFQKLGFETVTAANGTEGIIATGSLKVDVVLSDFHMPDMTGLEMIRRIRSSQEIDQQIPVIFMSGLAELSALTAESRLLVRKPFRAQDIEPLLREAVDHPENGRRLPEPAPTS